VYFPAVAPLQRSSAFATGVSGIAASHAGTLLRFSELALAVADRGCRSHWLWIDRNHRRLPGGTRSGVHVSRRAWFPYVAASACGRPFRCRPSIRVRRAGLIEPPHASAALSGANRAQQINPCTTFPEVCRPSAFAGCAASSEAASHRTMPLQRFARARGPPEVGAVAMRDGFVHAVLSPCVIRAPGPRQTIASRDSHRPGAGHSPRSLFRAAFRYPLAQALSQPGRTCDHAPVRQRSWD